MSTPIFISYSSKDQDIAETICRALESRALTCWISCRDVHPGENFQEAIVQALRTARVMVLVFTSNANNSDEIKKELVLAGRHRVTVVPVRVEDVVPTDAFSYELATRQWIDLFKNWEREIERLATRIGDILRIAAPQDGGVGEAPARTVAPNRVVKGRLNRRLGWVAALVVGLLATGGVTAYLRSLSQVPAAPTAPPQAGLQSPAEVPPSPAKSPDDLAWENATRAGTPAAFADYLQEFSAGSHAREAQLQMADLILAAPTTTKNFDGTWGTTWTCANVGQYLGYSYRITGQVDDGTYHGLSGTKGEPGSFELNGKITSDGTAAFFGEIIVASSAAALGAPAGTKSDFHALAQFAGNGGTGKRIDGRACNIAFVKQ